MCKYFELMQRRPACLIGSWVMNLVLLGFVFIDIEALHLLTVRADKQIELEVMGMNDGIRNKRRA